MSRLISGYLGLVFEQHLIDGSKQASGNGDSGLFCAAPFSQLLVFVRNFRMLFRAWISRSDTGTMEYTIKDMDVASAADSVHKEFINVELTEGKTFISTVSKDEPIQLLATDGDRMAMEVLEDGSEIAVSKANWLTGQLFGFPI